MIYSNKSCKISIINEFLTWHVLLISQKEVVSVRALVISTTFPRWENDTKPQFVYEFSKILGKEFEIVVLAPHCEGAKKFELMDGMKVFRFSYFHPIRYQKLAYGDGILPNISNSNLAKIQVPFLFIFELINAIRVIRNEKIDLVCSHWLVPQGFVGAVCKALFGTTHLLTIHAADIFGLERLPFKRKIGNFIVQNSDGINVVSSYIGERLLNLVSPELKDGIRQKLSIIPMGVHTKSIRINADKDQLRNKYKLFSKKNILFIGRFSEKKGIIYLIRAMPLVLSKVNDVCFILCGDGHLRSKIEHIVDCMDLRSHVIFTGYITNEEKNDYLGLADILVVPSIVTDLGDTEGLPVVILEGLAAGKAIITSDVSGIHDVIIDGYNGLLMEQKNSEILANKILYLLDDTRLLECLSKNALDSSPNYDWDVIGNKIITSIKLLFI